jgi:hypothetical protein
MKVGTTTTAATNHGFPTAEDLEGETTASVICPSGMDQRFVIVCRNFPASGPVGGLLM